MTVSRFDRLFRRLLLTKFFTRGWGSPENLRKLLEFRKTISNRELCEKLVAPDYPVIINKEFVSGDCRILEGSFLSPFVHQLHDVMPKEVETAKFQVVLPLQWKGTRRSICLQLAGTGDHGFWRRRSLMARPLIKEAEIASVLLENPYYGVRKPKSQLRSGLQNVLDLFVMGGALILESAVLLHWCERQGFGPLGISGVSMGGHMASLAATNWPKPISLIPCLSWSTASPVWTQGALSNAVSWRQLQSQYYKDASYASEITKLLSHPWVKPNKEPAERSDVPATGMHTPVINAVLDLAPEPFKPLIHRQVKSTASSQMLVTAGWAGSGFSRTSLRRALPDDDVIDFMRAVMDECTHLMHFSQPVDPSLVIAVAARQDGYVLRDNVVGLEELWPGCHVRYVDRGHVAAIIFDQGAFRRAIIDSFNLQIDKCHSRHVTMQSDAQISV